MKEDLANEELMRFYWENTGQDVRAYWISTRTYREYYGEQNIPSDLALYDDKLLIQYDEGTRTLQFDVIQADDGRLDIFERLTEQVEHDWNKPFQRIEPSQEVLAEKV